MSGFFNKLEKLDVLMIIFVVVVCLFALVMMLGWPEGDWGFGWGALGALGSLLTGLLAVRITWIQKEWIEEERKGEFFKIKEKITAGLILLKLFEDHQKKEVWTYDGSVFLLAFYGGCFSGLSLLSEAYNSELSNKLDKELLESLAMLSALHSYIKSFYDLQILQQSNKSEEFNAMKLMQEKTGELKLAYSKHFEVVFNRFKQDVEFNFTSTPCLATANG